MKGLSVTAIVLSLLALGGVGFMYTETQKLKDLVVNVPAQVEQKVNAVNTKITEIEANNAAFKEEVKAQIADIPSKASVEESTELSKSILIKLRNIPEFNKTESPTLEAVQEGAKVKTEVVEKVEEVPLPPAKEDKKR